MLKCQFQRLDSRYNHNVKARINENFHEESWRMDRIYSSSFLRHYQHDNRNHFEIRLNRNFSKHQIMTSGIFSDSTGIDYQQSSITSRISKHSSAQLTYRYQRKKMNQNELQLSMNARHGNVFSSWLATFKKKSPLYQFRIFCNDHGWKMILEPTWQKHWRAAVLLGYATNAHRLTTKIDPNNQQSLQTDFLFNSIWQISGMCRWHLKRKEILAYGWGNQLFSIFAVSFQILPKHKNNRYEISSTLQLPIKMKPFLSINSTFICTQSGTLDSYELIVQEFGTTYSPGILIAKDRSGFKRCEGFIEWQFY